MGQASPYLRRGTNFWIHWCPGCEETHAIFDSWSFNGDVNRPSFSPSVKITGKQTVKKDGEWTGEWVLGPDGKALDDCCHYYLTDGKLRYEGDSIHALSGKTVDLPELPEYLTDFALGIK